MFCINSTLPSKAAMPILCFTQKVQVVRSVIEFWDLKAMHDRRCHKSYAFGTPFWEERLYEENRTTNNLMNGNSDGGANKLLGSKKIRNQE
jgi:hypothetical protein